MIDHDAIFETLPRLAQDYTPEQREACVDWLSSLSMPELRQRQSIKAEEVDRAVKGRMPEDTILSVQEQDQQLFDAISRKLERGEA